MLIYLQISDAIASLKRYFIPVLINSFHHEQRNFCRTVKYSFGSDFYKSKFLAYEFDNDH